ncbi:MAG: hypothetical protein HFJ17_00035 [Clostridia bacterium]|nr:hypothetical protein [Clostridia bacterium]
MKRIYKILIVVAIIAFVAGVFFYMHHISKKFETAIGTNQQQQQQSDTTQATQAALPVVSEPNSSKSETDENQSKVEAQQQTSKSSNTAVSPEIPVEEEHIWIRMENETLEGFSTASEALERVREIHKETSDIHTLNVLVSGISLKSVKETGSPIVLNGIELFSGEEFATITDSGANLYTSTFKLVPIRNQYMYTIESSNGTVFYTVVKFTF